MRISLMIALLALTLIPLFFVGPTSAAPIASYDAGVAPTAGTTGAADPTGQGWTPSTLSPGSFNYGADSTNGGWRITDGTSGQGYFYSQALSGSDVSAMNTEGWVAKWKTAVNADAVQNTGVPNGVNDYYSSVPTRQNNNATWIEVNGSYRYILTHKTDANGDIIIGDGTTDYQVTNTGGNLSEELGGGPPSAFYVTYTLFYNSLSGTATLTDSLGGNHGVIATSGAATQDRVLWGATSSSGQGSTTWNEFSLALAIPEPSTIVLLSIGLFGLLGCSWRRKIRA